MEIWTTLEMWKKRAKEKKLAFTHITTMTGKVENLKVYHYSTDTITIITQKVIYLHFAYLLNQ